MIQPIVHQSLRRDDMARLVSAIHWGNPHAAQTAARELEEGRVDRVLDDPAALDAVRGYGGAPAPLPHTLLWYIPIRAALRDLGEHDIVLADFAASIPLAFLQSPATDLVHRGDRTLGAWWRAVAAVPANSRARAERAAQCGALALWWTGCFPQHVARGGGPGMIRAYLTFSTTMLCQAGYLVGGRSPRLAEVYQYAAHRVGLIHQALRGTAVDYLGSDAHSAAGRLSRYLTRLSDDLEWAH